MLKGGNATPDAKNSLKEIKLYESFEMEVRICPASK